MIERTAEKGCVKVKSQSVKNLHHVDSLVAIVADQFLAINSKATTSPNHDGFVPCCPIVPMRAIIFGVYLAVNANNNTKWSI
jgi:hypothetical protein